MATISRSEMQAAIAAGGVVLHDGRFYHDPNDLPTEADLAKGDPAKEAMAKADLQAQIDALKAQLAGLGGSHTPAPHPGPPVSSVVNAAAPAPAAAPPAPAPAKAPEKK